MNGDAIDDPASAIGLGQTGDLQERLVVSGRSAGAGEEAVEVLTEFRSGVWRPRRAVGPAGSEGPSAGRPGRMFRRKLPRDHRGRASGQT